jgi:transposase
MKITCDNSRELHVFSAKIFTHYFCTVPEHAGKSGCEIAQWLMIHRQTVSRVWQQFLTTGNITPKPKNSGRKPKITPQIMEKILLKIEKQPDITINGLIEELFAC